MNLPAGVRGWAGASVLLLVAVSTALPAGSIHGLNVKVAAFAVCGMLLALLALGAPRRPLATVGQLVTLAGCLAAVVLGVATAFGGDVELRHILGSASGFLATIGVAYVVSVTGTHGIVRPRQVLAAFLWSSFAFATAKTAVAIAISVGTLPFAAFRTWMLEVFDYSFVSMLIAPGVVRLHFVNDAVLPFALAFVLAADRFGLRLRRPVAAAFVVVYLAAIVLAYSRWTFLVTIALVALWAVLFAVRRPRQLIALATGLALMVSVAMQRDVLPVLISNFEDRFVSDAVVESDRGRLVQIEALVSEVAGSPLVGRGLGAHAPDVVQRVQEPYSYEVQWLAITLQLGAVGLVLVLVPLVALARRSLVVPRPRMAAFLSAALGLWLVSGLTNPYLISSTSGALFGLFALLPGIAADADR